MKQSMKPRGRRPAPIAPERRRPLEPGTVGTESREPEVSPIPLIDPQALSDALERDSRRFDRLLIEEE